MAAFFFIYFFLGLSVADKGLFLLLFGGPFLKVVVDRIQSASFIPVFITWESSRSICRVTRSYIFIANSIFWSCFCIAVLNSFSSCKRAGAKLTEFDNRYCFIYDFLFFVYVSLYSTYRHLKKDEAAFIRILTL
jgi:hypothetical protein